MLKYILAFIVITIIVISILLTKINTNINEQTINFAIDKSKVALQSQFNKEKIDALKIGLLLAKNKQLIDALENDDEDLGYEILYNITKNIKKHTSEQLRIQIITADKLIFARSWDDVYAGMPIGDYRKDLEYFEKSRSPRASIEVGAMLTLKTTIPIYKDGFPLGFIEVISLFDNVTSYLKNIGLDLYILMDDKYANISVLMRNNAIIDNFIIANKNYNNKNISILNQLNFEKLVSGDIEYKDKNYIFSQDMLNGNGKKIGIFVFVISRANLEYFKTYNNESISFVNLSRDELYETESNSQYKDIYSEKLNIQTLLSVKDNIPSKDKLNHIQLIRSKLNTYTKDELINFILNEKKVKTIHGEIR